ncbi:MAG: SdrD B-like domain-containing protein, partial [Thermoflexales bacterium]
FSFGGLPAGTFALFETQPAATHDDGLDALGNMSGTLSNDLLSGIVLTAGGAGTGYLFGERALPVITGFVYLDQNNDGLFNPIAESGMYNEQVIVTGTNDLGQSVWLTLTTLSNIYGFFNTGPIRPGLYSVSEVQPGLYLDGIDTPGAHSSSAGNDRFTTVLTLGQSSGGNLFGELSPAQLYGRVFVDLDGDGLPYYYEPGIGGVTVTLAGIDDRSAAVLTLTLSDASGAFAFYGLRPGIYTVTESQPISYADGLDGGSGAIVANDVFSFTIGSGGYGGAYFGETARGIVGLVLTDLNNNGLRDSGEYGIAGVPITLTDSAGVTRAQTTNQMGFFVFEGLLSGTYTLTEAQPSYYNYDLNALVTYFDGRESAGNGGGVTSTNDVIAGIIYTAGDTLNGYVFGELSRSSLRGFVWLDYDADSVYDYDSNEPYLRGVTITLSGIDDRGASVSAITQTLPLCPYSYCQAQFRFFNLRPGTYTLTELQPAGYANGGSFPGDQGGVPGDNLISSIHLSRTGDLYNHRFSEYIAGLSGIAYLDQNNNGLREPGDGTPYMPYADYRARIRMTGVTTGNVAIGPIDRDVDEYGVYSFTNVASGVYTLTEIKLPLDYYGRVILDGREQVGSLGGFTVSTTTVAGIVYTAGLTGVNYNFGHLFGANAEANVYLDIDEDGYYTGTADFGLNGVIVNLIGIDDLGGSVWLTSTTTNSPNYPYSLGRATFAGLRPGTYALVEQQPPGYFDGAEISGTISYQYTRTVQAEDRFTITLYQAEVARNFAFLERAGGISGYVFRDANNNGVRDPGETPIKDVYVQISGTDVLTQVTTNAQGFYIFTPLPPDVYSLTQPYAPYVNFPYFDYPFCNNNCYQALLDGRDQIGSLGGITTTAGAMANIVFSPTTRGRNYNFGELYPGRFEGRVFRDDNGNGQPDAGEALVNVTMILSGTDDLGRTVNVSVTTVSLNGYNGGYFRFKDLRPGSYVLIEEQPAGVLDGPDFVQGGAPGVAGNDVITGIVLGEYADFDNAYLFSELPAGIAGKVIADRDMDGIETYRDVLMQGVQVAISGTTTSGGAIYSSTTTNAQGNFLFLNVPTGVYDVIETQVSVYTGKVIFDGPETAGVNGGITTTNDVIASIPYTSGTSATGYIFAEYFGASLAGSVYFDVDENGFFSTGQGDV